MRLYSAVIQDFIDRRQDPAGYRGVAGGYFKKNFRFRFFYRLRGGKCHDDKIITRDTNGIIPHQTVFGSLFEIESHGVAVGTAEFSYKLVSERGAEHVFPVNRDRRYYHRGYLFESYVCEPAWGVKRVCSC